MLTGEPVVRVRPGPVVGVDAHHVPVRGPETSVVIDGALVDPGGSVQPIVAGADPVITTPTAYFPDQAPDIIAGDALIVRGVRHQVVGDPGAWATGSQATPGGLVVKLSVIKKV